MENRELAKITKLMSQNHQTKNKILKGFVVRFVICPSLTNINWPYTTIEININ